MEIGFTMCWGGADKEGEVERRKMFDLLDSWLECLGSIRVRLDSDSHQIAHPLFKRMASPRGILTGERSKISSGRSSKISGP